MPFLLVVLTSFLIGFLIMPIVIKFLEKARMGDRPGGRRIHKKFIPSMGGIGFFVAASFGVAIWGWQIPLAEVQFFLGAILLMFFVGLRDDSVELKPLHKLLGQLAAVLLVVVVADIRISNFFGFLGIGELPVFLSYGFSAFVLLALTNSFNLIDGLDGLAGTMAVFVFSVLGGWFVLNGMESYALLSFSFMGAVLSFLVFNWHPAKIFMGDTGSLTLGFTLGTLLIVFMDSNGNLPADAPFRLNPIFAAGVAVMLFPLYDMARVFARRILKGKGPMTPDKSHVHHFMARMGLRHDQVALFIGGLQVLTIVFVFLLRDFSDHVVLPLIVLEAVALGALLDGMVVKYVRKKVEFEHELLKEADPVSAIFKSAPAQKEAKKKIEVPQYEESDINLN